MVELSWTSAIQRARRPAAIRSSPRVLAAVALVGANVVWGGSAAASKAAIEHLPPLTLACLRVAVALVVLRVLLRLLGQKPQGGRGSAVLGLFGVTVFCAGQNLGLLFASASATSLINGAIPVLTASMAMAFLGERLGMWRLSGLLISLGGIELLVIWGADAPGGPGLGSLLPLASAVGFALYGVLGRRLFRDGNALAVVAGSTQYGLIFLLPGALIELATVGVGPMTVADGFLVLYLAVGCSALAFVLMGYGLKHLDVGHGAAFGAIKPIVGVVLAVAFLGEPVTPGVLGGGILVLVGVGIASRRSTDYHDVRRPVRREAVSVGVSVPAGGRRRAQRGV